MSLNLQDLENHNIEMVLIPNIIFEFELLGLELEEASFLLILIGMLPKENEFPMPNENLYLSIEEMAKDLRKEEEEIQNLLFSLIEKSYLTHISKSCYSLKNFYDCFDVITNLRTKSRKDDLIVLYDAIREEMGFSKLERNRKPLPYQ